MKALSGTVSAVTKKSHLSTASANGWPIPEAFAKELDERFGILKAPAGWGLPPYKDSDGVGVWGWEVKPKDPSIMPVTLIIYSDLFKKSGKGTRLFVWDHNCVPETWSEPKACHLEAAVTALQYAERTSKG
jgi:hypothetical protein